MSVFVSVYPVWIEICKYVGETREPEGSLGETVFKCDIYYWDLCTMPGVTDRESLRPLESQSTKVESLEIPSRSELNRFGNVRTLLRVHTCGPGGGARKNCRKSKAARKFCYPEIVGRFRAAPAEASQAARGGSRSRGWTWNLGRVPVRHPCY